MNTRQSMAQLVAAAQGGDVDARRELYTRALGRVTATARRRVRQSHDVSDVVQEAFARAFASLDSLNDAAAFTSWVAQIAANVANDLHRSEARVDLGDDALAAMADASADPAELNLARDLSHRTLQELGALGDRDREILLLRDAYAIEVAEIARRLHISQGATRTRLTRARKRAAVLLTGMLSWLPATMAARVRRWMEHSRLLSPIPMTATAAILSLATVPLVDAVLHELATPPAMATEIDAQGRVLRAVAEVHVEPSTHPTPVSSTKVNPTASPLPPANEELARADLVLNVSGPAVNRRRAKDRDVGLVIRDRDGNTLLDVGSNVPDEIAGPLRDAGLLGHEVVVTLGEGIAIDDRQVSRQRRNA